MENGGTLTLLPPAVEPPKEPFWKGIYARWIPMVYMGLMIKGTIPRVPPFSLWRMRRTSPHISKNHVFEAADAPEQEVADQPMQPAKVAVEDQVRAIHGEKSHGDG